MPIYEYRCENGHIFEVMQKMTDDPVTELRGAARRPVQRVFHPVAVHFKGTGFYNTDYGTAAAQPRARALRPRTARTSRRRPRRQGLVVLVVLVLRQLGVELEQELESTRRLGLDVVVVLGEEEGLAARR